VRTLDRRHGRPPSLAARSPQVKIHAVREGVYLQRDRIYAPYGMGMLIVSHFLTERERLDRVYELRDGKAVAG
jgi:hypothetical protein